MSRYDVYRIDHVDAHVDDHVESVEALVLVDSAEAGSPIAAASAVAEDGGLELPATVVVVPSRYVTRVGLAARTGVQATLLDEPKAGR